MNPSFFTLICHESATGNAFDSCCHPVSSLRGELQSFSEEGQGNHQQLELWRKSQGPKACSYCQGMEELPPLLQNGWQ